MFNLLFLCLCAKTVIDDSENVNLASVGLRFPALTPSESADGNPYGSALYVANTSKSINSIKVLTELL